MRTFVEEINDGMPRSLSCPDGHRFINTEIANPNAISTRSRDDLSIDVLGLGGGN